VYLVGISDSVKIWASWSGERPTKVITMIFTLFLAVVDKSVRVADLSQVIVESYVKRYNDHRKNGQPQAELQEHQVNIGG
jgi:hypothetical protein